MGQVRVRVDAGVAVVEIDSPTSRNAIDPAIAEALMAACDDIDGDESVGGVVLQGAGGYFCSGGDRAVLGRIGQNPLEPQRFDQLSVLYESFTRFGRLRAPSVAAVRGGAVGAGLNLAMAADVRIISRDAVLIPGFAEIGLHPGGGHMYLLHALSGPQTAAAMGVMGARITGDRAAELGLAWESLPDHEVESRAVELVAMAAADPVLARMAKHSLRHETGREQPWESAVQIERVAQIWSMARAAATRRTPTQR